MNGELIENTLSSYGLRWMHVVNMGKPVDRELWISQAPFYAAGLQTQIQYERGLDVHHLRIWWHAREPIVLQCTDDGWNGRQVLLWYIERGQTLREAAMYAGLAYLEVFGRWPNTALVARRPQGAPGTFELWADETERVEAQLIEAEWVPRNFLVLAEEAR